MVESGDRLWERSGPQLNQLNLSVRMKRRVVHAAASGDLSEGHCRDRIADRCG